jgi:hypothetical protein
MSDSVCIVFPCRSAKGFFGMGATLEEELRPICRSQVPCGLCRSASFSVHFWDPEMGPRVRSSRLLEPRSLKRPFRAVTMSWTIWFPNFCSGS